MDEEKNKKVKVKNDQKLKEEKRLVRKFKEKR